MGSDRYSDGQRGFSLVELLVALLILSFIALGIASLFSHAQLTNASGYEYALLASEARRTIEALQATQFLDPALAATGGTARDWVAAREGFTIQYTVQDFEIHTWADMAANPPPVPATPADANVKQITVRVSSDTRILRGRRQFVATALKITG
jgi:prepilin-type N-terminal cleavage/methylation domain-containing protein